MNEAANDSARVSGQDRKKPPALGTNQIAGFGGFRPLASSEKNKCMYHMIIKCLEENYTLFDEIFYIFKVYITKQSLLTRLQHCGIAAL